MKEWKKVRLKDIVAIRKDSVSPIDKEEYTLYSLPSFDNGQKPEKAKGIEIKSSKLRVFENTILYNKLNIRFKRVWNVNFIPCSNSICSTEFIPISPTDRVNQDFLYYNLISDDFTNLMEGKRTGTSNSHQRINLDDLLNHELSLPSLDVQKQIADILSSLDDKIALNKRINDNLFFIFVLFIIEILEKQPIIKRQSTKKTIDKSPILRRKPRYSTAS